MKLNKGMILGAMFIGAIALTGCSNTEVTSDSNEMTEEVKISYSDLVNNKYENYEYKTKGDVAKDTVRKNKCNSDATNEEVEELLNKFMEGYYDKNKFIISTAVTSGDYIHITFIYKNREYAENYDGDTIKEESEKLGEYLKNKYYEEENIYIETVGINVRDDFEDMLFHIRIY